MKKHKRYIQIIDVTDKRKKSHRIIQAYSGIASAGKFFIHRTMVSFIEQFVGYPNVNFDDELDSVAMALHAAEEFDVMAEGEDGLDDDLGTVVKLQDWRTAA